MILSMTGFGRHQTTFNDKSITIELRSLNSKYTDVKLKLPVNYRDKEGELRAIFLDVVKRGKIECTIDIQSGSGSSEIALNTQLFKQYYAQLNDLCGELGIEKDGIIPSILRIPNVIGTPNEEIPEEEWTHILKSIHKTIETFDTFRIDEGQAMYNDLDERIRNIHTLLQSVEPHQKKREETIRARMSAHLEEFLGKENVDKNRFEQEIIYYLEKIDISEEQVRLSQHLKYFLEQLNAETITKGRKLSFITQEMGREINTLGAKAYSSEIQKIVVQMKDQLEKIKEQVANIV